jgi:hypothetical protein
MATASPLPELLEPMRFERSVTVINVYGVRPADQAVLLTLVGEIVAEAAEHVPGFVWGDVHASLDGRRVISSMHWESLDAYEASHRDPGLARHQRAARVIASPEPRLYRLESIRAA